MRRVGGGEGCRPCFFSYCSSSASLSLSLSLSLPSLVIIFLLLFVAVVIVVCLRLPLPPFLFSLLASVPSHFRSYYL